MKEIKIKVKKYMTMKSTPDFDFMTKFNNDVPMPYRIMVGEVEKRTAKMVYMNLHADIYADVMSTCMKCGRVLTNTVSQYFGIGPECGNHNYVNPFDSKEELQQAVNEYRKTLLNVKWEGWIPISAIEVLDGDNLESATPQPKTKVTITVKDSKAVVAFDYNYNVVEAVKSVPNRKYNPDTKNWVIDADYVEELINNLDNVDVEVVGKLPEKETINADDFDFKTKPFAHQIDGFNYGLANKRWLLGDEQGLGKTKQVIDIAVAKKQLGYKHCLIICGVNGLKWNWKEEVKTHSNEKAFILGQRYKRNKLVIGSTSDKIADLTAFDSIDEYFIITNIESLRNEDILGLTKNLCDAGKINMIAFDECHKAKNPTTQQGKALLKLNADTMIAMSGTPLMNNPLDLYVPLKWLGYENRKFYSFKNAYCEMGGFGGYEIMGYKNLNELENRLQNVMLRRRKQDVLDLPEKLYINEYVDMTPKQAILYKEALNEVIANIDKVKSDPNPLAKLIRMRQATGYTGILSNTIQESAKLDRMEELVEEAIENGKKVVIFSNWTQMTDVIAERILDMGWAPLVITGQTKDEERQQMVWNFQNRENNPVIIGTIGAMGTGLTLTAGTVEIFMDEPWNRANKEQAEDRCHRVGTTENVTIYTLMCKDTIDERIHELILEKGALSDAIVDGVKGVDKSALIDYLIA